MSSQLFLFETYIDLARKTLAKRQRKIFNPAYGFFLTSAACSPQNDGAVRGAGFKGPPLSADTEWLTNSYARKLDSYQISSTSIVVL